MSRFKSLDRQQLSSSLPQTKGQRFVIHFSWYRSPLGLCTSWEGSIPVPYTPRAVGTCSCRHLQLYTRVCSQMLRCLSTEHRWHLSPSSPHGWDQDKAFYMCITQTHLVQRQKSERSLSVMLCSWHFDTLIPFKPCKKGNRED